MDYELIYQKLNQDPDMAAFAGGRWYPLVLPQKSELPAGTYRRISSVPVGESARVSRTRVQFSCFGESYVQARQLASLVKSAFDNLAAQSSAVSLKNAWLDSEIEFYEDDTQTYVIHADYFFYLVQQ